MGDSDGHFFLIQYAKDSTLEITKVLRGLRGESVHCEDIFTEEFSGSFLVSSDPDDCIECYSCRVDAEPLVPAATKEVTYVTRYQE